jgi:hypothetical protein
VCLIQAIVFVLLCMFGNLGFAQISSKGTLPSTAQWCVYVPQTTLIIIHEGTEKMMAMMM